MENTISKIIGDYRGIRSKYPRGCKLSWIEEGSDSEAAFIENSKKHKGLQYYIDNPITYSFNNYGYRTPYNFKKGDDVNVYLGCSHTMGTGHHLENTWVHQLNEKLDCGHMVNFGQSGRGIENQFRTLYRFKDFFNIKNIFHFQPLYNRECFFSKNKEINFQIHTPPPYIDKNINPQFLVDTFGSDKWMIQKYITNIMAIENIASKLGVNYYYEFDWSSHPYTDVLQARDLKHHDVVEHMELCNTFYSRFKNLDTTIKLFDGEDNHLI